MAWETRSGKGRYYTRSRKVNGRVRREYVGTGPAGEAAAQVDALERTERAIERARLLAEQDVITALADPAVVLARFADALARGALMTAGYRQHHRGEWRKQRVQND